MHSYTDPQYAWRPTILLDLLQIIIFCTPAVVKGIVYDQFKKHRYQQAYQRTVMKWQRNCYFTTIRHRSSSLIPGIPDLAMHCGSDCGGRSWIWLVPLVNDSKRNIDTRISKPQAYHQRTVIKWYKTVISQP